MRARIRRGENGLVLEGVLDFDSVARLLPEGDALLAGPGSLDLDLSGVREANSAGLALLLEWLSLARERDLRLRLRNLPEPLERLAALADVSELLGAAGA
jgi:phospholipid transport system transporter-binding protein